MADQRSPRPVGGRGRVAVRLRRAARTRRNAPTSRGARLASLVVVVLAGAMTAVSANLSQGSELRPNRNDDMAGLVRSRAEANKALQEQAAALRREVDQMSRTTGSTNTTAEQQDDRAVQAGLTAVKGPAVSVQLTDAPLTVQPIGVDEDLLVVHQQDIQTVVNALWSGGAEAMTIQGQRVTSLTGIKCVGNTVVLHGVPYAPPYVVTAIGDTRRMQSALASSHEIDVYKQYVKAYHLGWKQEVLPSVTMPAYEGTLDLPQASVPR